MGFCKVENYLEIKWLTNLFVIYNLLIIETIQENVTGQLLAFLQNL